MPETKQKWDGSAWRHPGGAGSSSYYSGYGGEDERKYHFQKGQHGKFDSFGRTEYLPEGGVGPFAQFEAERIMQGKKAALHESAQQIRGKGFELLGSYRPGGLAQMTSGILERQAGAQERYGEGLETPYLLYKHDRDRARRQRRQARRAARFSAVTGLLGQAAGAALGAAMGGGAGAAGAAGAAGTATDGAGQDPWSASRAPGPQGQQPPGAAPPDPGAPSGPMDGAQANTQGSHLSPQGPGGGQQMFPGGEGAGGGAPAGPGGGPPPGGPPPAEGGMPGGSMPMAMSGGSDSIFAGAGQESYAGAPMSAIASGGPFDGEQLLDVALAEEPRLFGATWNDMMFDRLSELAEDDYGNEFWDDDEEAGDYA